MRKIEICKYNFKFYTTWIHERFIEKIDKKYFLIKKDSYICNNLRIYKK